MHEPTPILFYLPRQSVEINDDGTVDTAAVLQRIGATEIAFVHADLHQADWAGLRVHASAQSSGDLVRLVLEIPVMEWIEMRVCRPDRSLMDPERSRRLIDHFAVAADELECLIAFKSVTTLPLGWANWDVFLPDFDRIAECRDPHELVRQAVDFGYAADDLEIAWFADGSPTAPRPGSTIEPGDPVIVLDSIPGMIANKGVVWFGDRMPALVH